MSQLPAPRPGQPQTVASRAHEPNGPRRQAHPDLRVRRWSTGARALSSVFLVVPTIDSLNEPEELNAFMRSDPHARATVGVHLASLARALGVSPPEMWTQVTHGFRKLKVPLIESAELPDGSAYKVLRSEALSDEQLADALPPTGEGQSPLRLLMNQTCSPELTDSLGLTR